MSGLRRFLPVATLLSDRLVIGESRHSSKEFICSVRPSLSDRFRLGAVGQIIELRQAENDPFETVRLRASSPDQIQLADVHLRRAVVFR